MGKLAIEAIEEGCIMLKNNTSSEIIFSLEDEYCLHRSDINFWLPYIGSVLERNDIFNSINDSTVVCGFNPT
jgi:hypothetical protein